MIAKRKNTLASKLLMAFLSVALVFTMMPLSMGFAYAADAADYQPALTITGPDGAVKTYQTPEDVVAAFSSGTDTESFGVELEGIYVKKLLSGYDADAIVNVQTQDDYDVSKLNANGKTVQELKDMKGILAYKENGVQYDPTSDEVNDKGKKLYNGYFIWYVGTDSEGKVLKDKWVNRITITKESSGEQDDPEEPVKPADVLTVTGDDLINPLSYDTIKTLKNDAAINPLIKENVSFHTLNSSNTEADFVVTGVTIEDLIKLAGLKEGMELDSVTATANDGYSKTYTADQILKEDLQGNKAMFIWDENGEKVQKTAVGQFAPDDQNMKFWVKGDTIALTVKAKAVEPAPAVLTIKGDDLVNPLSYDTIKTLKNDAAINPLIKENVSFHTLNSSGTEEDFTVTGVTIESLVNLAGLKEGMELDSVTATADDGYAKTYSAEQILNEDLQGNKAMFIWDEDGAKVQKTVVGQFAKDDQNKKLWVKGNTIELTVTAKVKEVVPPVPAKVTRPGRVTFKSLKAGKKKAYLKWGKVKNAKGYIIYRATKKNGKYKVVKTIKKGSTVKWTNTKLKKGKTYYYKIKAYKMNNGKKLLSKKFSIVKKVKIK